MRQSGTVISTRGSKAKVLLERQSACGDCKGCRWGDEDMSMEIEAINSANAKTGDRVEINMENQDVFKAAFIAYAIPLFALIIGVIIGSKILGIIGLQGEYKEIGSGIIGFVLTGVTYFGIKTREKTLKKNKNYIPVISEISNK